MSVADQLSHHFGREAMRQHHPLGATVGGGAGEQRECTTALRDALERRRRRYAIGRLTGHDMIYTNSTEGRFEIFSDFVIYRG
jgi:hypothetical protein